MYNRFGLESTRIASTSVQLYRYVPYSLLYYTVVGYGWAWGYAGTAVSMTSGAVQFILALKYMLLWVI